MLTPLSSPRGKLLSQYVCARIPSLEGIDIGLFDYDRHNALYYFILNADEQIYMRYGGRDASYPDAYLDLASLEIALQLGLERHRLYTEGNLKRRPRPAPLFPRDIPLVRSEVLGRGRCIECHLVADFQAQGLEIEGRLDKLRDMFVYPDIHSIGIELDVPKGLVVKDAFGPARMAGVLPGDKIVAIEGTPVLTFGDFQHFYNKLSRDAAQVRITLERDGGEIDSAVRLPSQWWWTDLEHRYWSIDPILPFRTRRLSVRELEDGGFDVAGFAAEIVYVNERAWPKDLDPLRVGDIIYGVEGVEADPRTRNLETYLRLHATAGRPMAVQIVRDEERLTRYAWTRRWSFRK